MKSYLLKLEGQEEGPFTEGQIAQMFADGRVDRHTPCRPATGGDWKTIDDYLPMLKYGTQRPAASPPTPPRGAYPGAVAAAGAPFPSGAQPIVITDIDLPFFSIVKLLFKWMGAALIVGICMIPVFVVLWLLLMALFAGVVGGIMSGMPRP